MSTVDIAGYLDRLGLGHPGAPSVDALAELRRAHVELVPYETLDIHLGRTTSVDPHEAAARIVGRQHGGHCFHLNGAFAVCSPHSVIASHSIAQAYNGELIPRPWVRMPTISG